MFGGTAAPVLVEGDTADNTDSIDIVDHILVELLPVAGARLAVSEVLPNARLVGLAASPSWTTGEYSG